jgi:hypothetical protein
MGQHILGRPPTVEGSQEPGCRLVEDDDSMERENNVVRGR